MFAILGFIDVTLSQTTQPTTETINILDIGAVGDGKAINTATIQRALNVVSSRGGGEVVVPAGRFVTGSLVIGPNTTLRLSKDAVLIGSRIIDDYPIINVRWDGVWRPGHRALLSANHADRFAILGEGKIIGPPFEVSNLRPNAESGTARGPVLIEPINCRDVRIEGISIEYQRMWSLHPTLCRDVIIRNVTIRSPTGPGFRGGGGIDIDSCANVLIEGCDVETGDDALVLRSGREASGQAHATEEIRILNTRLASPAYAAFAIGPELSGGVRNVRMENGSLTRALHAVHIKGRTGHGGFIDNVAFESVQFQGPLRTAITINLENSGPVSREPLSGDAAFPKVSNLSFNTIRVLATHLMIATEIAPEMPVQNVTLSNFNGQSPEGIQVANVRNLVLKNIRLTGYLAEFLRATNVTGPKIETMRSPRDTLEPGTTLPVGD